MYAKIQIKGTVEVVTGMHIGGSSAFAAIGAIDSPVIKETTTGLPMIPGSSFKGKMRSLLAKQYNQTPAGKPDEDDDKLLRLFGSAKKNGIKRGRLIFSDMLLCNEGELRSKGVSGITEIKFENNINRLSAVATPRQIERVIRGAQFPLDLIYEIGDDSQILEDFETIKNGFKLLEFDYLGGSGSRGYGKIQIKNLDIENVIGNVDKALLDECKRIFDEFL